MKNNSNIKKKGFTLIEVLVIVLILGVLGSIALPIYNRSVERTRIAQGVDTLSHIAKAEMAHNVKHGQYTNQAFMLALDVQDAAGNSANSNSFSDDYFNYTLTTSDATAVRKTNNYTLKVNYDTGEVICTGNCNLASLPSQFSNRERYVPPFNPTFNGSNPAVYTPPQSSDPVVSEEPEEPAEVISSSDPVPARFTCQVGVFQKFYGWGNNMIMPGTFCQYRETAEGGIEFIECETQNNCTKRTLDKYGRDIGEEVCVGGNYDENYECKYTTSVMLDPQNIYDEHGNLIACKATTEPHLCPSGPVGNGGVTSWVYETDELGRIIRSRACRTMEDDGTCTEYDTMESGLLEFTYDDAGNLIKTQHKTCESSAPDANCVDIGGNTEIYSKPESHVPDKHIVCGDEVANATNCVSYDYEKDANDNITLIKICMEYNPGDNSCSGGSYLSFATAATYDDQGNMLTYGYATLDGDGNVVNTDVYYTYETGENGTTYVRDETNGSCTVMAFGVPQGSC